MSAYRVKRSPFCTKSKLPLGIFPPPPHLFCNSIRTQSSLTHDPSGNARDWTRLQTLLKLPKEDIVDVVKNLFERVDVEHHGSVPWGKFCDAMLLLCGKRFSVYPYHCVVEFIMEEGC